MEWVLRLVGTGIDGQSRSCDVLEFSRADGLGGIAGLGLTLVEAKQRLARVQREVVAAQASNHAMLRPDCRSCAGTCHVKDSGTDITALIRRSLETVGRTDDTEVTAFTDGCPGLRSVPAAARVTKPPILDWFHIAMRLQHAKQAAGSLSIDEPDRVHAKAVIVAEVERLRWRIWNGKASDARLSIDRIR